MCMYFSTNAAQAYDIQIEKRIAEHIGNAISQFNYSQFPDKLPGKVHLSIRLTPSSNQVNLINLTVDVLDGTEKTATFEQHDIPFEPLIDQRASFWETKLSNGYFWRNSTALFLRDNVWTTVLRPYLSYIPDKAVTEFLKQAFH